MSCDRRAVIYARYSSHSQRDASIEQQIEACKRFAERNAIAIVSIYEDRATTGTNDNRPGFQRMVKDAERGDWEYVIIYTLDRFARNRYDSAVYKRRLKECGVKVLSAMEQISDDPTGILMESLLEGLAEYYSSELSRKIRRGMDDNASKCLCNGHIPYGYRRGADGRFEIEENEAAIVREIYQRIRSGDKLIDLINDINNRGILNKRGNAWTHSTFNSMLSNERYTGIYIYGNMRTPGGMPRIIEQDLYDEVQLILHTKKNPRKNAVVPADSGTTIPRRRRQQNGIYYLTGKLFCGHCHSPMIGVSGRSKTGPLYYYYTCKGKRDDHSCKKKNVGRDFIEKVIAGALKETMLNDRAIGILADAAVAYQAKQSGSEEMDMLQAREIAIKKSISNFLAAIEAGIFSSTTQNRLMELEGEQRIVSARLAQLRQDANDLLTREEIIATLRMFRDGDICEASFREAMFDTFLVSAYVYDDQIKIVFNLGGKSDSMVLPVDIDTLFDEETSISSGEVHQSILYEHFGVNVVMIGDLFVFAVKY